MVYEHPFSETQGGDSAVESGGDEDLDDTDDKSPNCDVVINLMEVQSSTESDKTVLSFRDNNLSSVPNSPFGGSPRSGSSQNLRQKLCLVLPEIIVEPCSPPATSPSTESSPTAAFNSIKKESSSSTTSSTSSITLGSVYFFDPFCKQNMVKSISPKIF